MAIVCRFLPRPVRRGRHPRPERRADPESKGTVRGLATVIRRNSQRSELYPPRDAAKVKAAKKDPDSRKRQTRRKLNQAARNSEQLESGALGAVGGS
jgi:hypothetical protein